MIAYLEGKRYRRSVLDSDIDGDVIRKGYRKGEQFYDVYYSESKKRVRTVACEGEGYIKRVRLEDSTPIKHR